jgi:hypothetical protein
MFIHFALDVCHFTTDVCHCVTQWQNKEIYFHSLKPISEKTNNLIDIHSHTVYYISS